MGTNNDIPIFRKKLKTWYTLLIIIKHIHIIKTLKCDLCDATAEGETFEGWMKALMPHYMEAHADVMESHSKDKEEMETEKKKRVTENKARFGTDAV